MPGKAKYVIAVCAAMAAGVALSACSSENWDWQWWKKSQSGAQTKPTAKRTTPTSEQPKTAVKQPTHAPEKADSQAKEVDAKVRRYVQSMDQSSEPVQNDFNSKIARQEDPDRAAHIRQVAARSAQASDSPDFDSDATPPVWPEVADETGTGSGTEQPAVLPAKMEPQSRRQSSSPSLSPARRDQAEAPGVADLPKTTQTERPSGVAEKAEAPVDKHVQEVAKATEEHPAAKEASTTAVKPPVLEKIEVAAKPQPQTTSGGHATNESAATSNAPASTPPAVVDTFQQRIKDQEAIVAKDPDNLAEQYRLRMMYLLAGRDADALSLSDGVDAETQQIIQAQVRTLMAAEGLSGRDPAAGANQLLEPVRNLENLIRAKADLQVPKVVLCTSAQSYGIYDPIEPAEFPAGRRTAVIIYVEVDNFSSETTASGYFRTLLSVRPSLLNKAGEELWSTSYENIEDLSRQRRRDFFLIVKGVIPASLAPGEYVLKIEVEDVLGGKINSNMQQFKVVALPETTGP